MPFQPSVQELPVFDVDELLHPIPGDNPSGPDMRYDPRFATDTTYSKIEEARRVNSQPWGLDGTINTVDYRGVIGLCAEFIEKKSKDLQVAAWLTEALLHEYGFRGLEQGLAVLQGLIAQYWETLYPALDDEDARRRAAPLKWVGFELDVAVRKRKLTQDGFDWYECSSALSAPGTPQGSQSGTDQGNEDSWGRLKIAIQKSSLKFFEDLLEHIEGSIAALESLARVSDKKFKETIREQLRISGGHSDSGKLEELYEKAFAETAPCFSKLHTGLLDVYDVTQRLAQKKGKASTQEPENGPQPSSVFGTVPKVAADPNGSTKTEAAETQAITRDEQDPQAKIVQLAADLREQDPSSPVAYLVLRAIRWGELRTTLRNSDSVKFNAPTSVARLTLRHFEEQGQWADLIEEAEQMMATVESAPWLDLQRYVLGSCKQLGSEYEAVSAAVSSELKTLLEDFPQLPGMSFADGTPVASTETRAWLRQEIQTPRRGSVERSSDRETDSAQERANSGAAAFEQATNAVQTGDIEDAITILTNAAFHEGVGRTRFQLRIQLVRILMEAHHEAIARAILEELVSEIEALKLGDWESPNVVIEPFALLLECLVKLERSSDERLKVYDRICQIDPAQALAFQGTL